jgi:hypothetical protein
VASDAVEAQFAAALAVAASELAAAIQTANIAAKSRTDAAEIEAKATIQAAQAHSSATLAAATVQAEASRYGSKVGADATIAASQVHAAAIISGADIQAAASTASANIQANATTQAATIHANATTEAANVQSNATRDAANAQKEASVESASIRANADIQTESIRLTGTELSAQLGLQGTEYSADRQVVGVDHREAGETNRLNIKLAWADGKWNEVFPFVQGVIENQISGNQQSPLSSAARWQSLQSVLGVPPPVYVSEVWTPQEVQLQLNSVYARTTATAQSRTRLAEIDLAGRGLSSDSPIMDVLRLGYEGYALMASTQAETETTIKLSSENVEAILKSQTAAVEAYTKLAGSYVDLEKNAVQLDVGTLQAVASMLGGVV